MPEEFDWGAVEQWDNEELQPVDVEGVEGDFFVDTEGFLLDAEGDFLLDDSGQLINSNNQYVIDENGEWLLVDTEGGVILGLDTGEGWNLNNIGLADTALAIGLAGALVYGARCFVKNYNKAYTLPKEIKRRFKSVLGDGQPNNAAVHDESASHREQMDDPATNFAHLNDEEETKSSELLGRKRQANNNQSSMSDSLY